MNNKFFRATLGNAPTVESNQDALFYAKKALRTKQGYYRSLGVAWVAFNISTSRRNWRKVDLQVEIHRVDGVTYGTPLDAAFQEAIEDIRSEMDNLPAEAMNLIARSEMLAF